MTNHFISRLAARALGQVPLAVPGTRASSDRALVGGGIEQVEESAAKPAPAASQLWPPRPDAIAPVDETPTADVGERPRVGTESPANGSLGLASTVAPPLPIAPPKPAPKTGLGHRLNPRNPSSAAPVASPDAQPLEPAGAESHATPIPSLALTVAGPTPARRAPPSAVPEAATPEPVVHVTIGRVDVQAIAGPPRARAERRPPGPTLAEYLARRNRDEHGR